MEQRYYMTNAYNFVVNTMKQLNSLCCKLIFPIYYDEMNDSDSDNDIEDENKFIVVTSTQPSFPDFKQK